MAEIFDPRITAYLFSKIHPFSEIPSPFADIQPSNLVTEAQILHPEELCIKNVHVGTVVRTNRGDIYMYGRNGMYDASPNHLREFRVGSLRQRAKAPETYPELVQYFDSLPEQLDDKLFSCQMILNFSGCAYCLKGFSWDRLKKEEKDKVQDSNVACPNNRAKGCTERLFLKWLYHAIQFQDDLIDQYKILEEGEPFAIKHIQFTHPDDPYANIEFAKGNGKDALWLKIDGVLPTQANLDDKIIAMLMATQYTPCEDCANTFHNSPLKDKLQVHIMELSRHKIDTLVPGIQLDYDDIRALTQMIKDIPVSFDDMDKIRLLRRG